MIAALQRPVQCFGARRRCNRLSNEFTGVCGVSVRLQLLLAAVLALRGENTFMVSLFHLSTLRRDDGIKLTHACIFRFGWRGGIVSVSLRDKRGLFHGCCFVFLLCEEGLYFVLDLIIQVQ